MHSTYNAPVCSSRTERARLLEHDLFGVRDFFVHEIRFMSSLRSLQDHSLTTMKDAEISIILLRQVFVEAMLSI